MGIPFERKSRRERERAGERGKERRERMNLPYVGLLLKSGPG